MPTAKAPEPTDHERPDGADGERLRHADGEGRRRVTTAIPGPNGAAGSDGGETPDTRERILRATFELIGREGIGSLSNRRIATAADLSLGSLTYHFPSQADLLRESLSLYVEEEVARLEAIAADLRARCPSPEEVAAEVQRLAAESADRPQQIAELELHLHAARDPALQEASQRCFAAYEGVAAAALEALGVPDAARHGRTVVALITGMGVQWQGTGRHDAAGLAGALLTIVHGARIEGDAAGDSRTGAAKRSAGAEQEPNEGGSR